MSSHNYDTTLTHNFVRPGGQQEPIKTGGILIRPEDALPQYQDQIHTNPRNNVSYATLKPWVQIQDEQGGIVHSTGSSTSVDMMSMSAPVARFDERPITNAPPSRVYSRQFTYEFMREKPDSDVMKTGGIVVNPSDVHTSQRHSVQKDPKSGVSYAMLKPWTQIQGNQGGIVHSRQQEVGPRKVDEIDKSRHRRTYTSVHDFVQPDVMGIQNQMAQSEILHRSKTEIDHIQQREPHFTPSQPADILHVPGAHTTRVIKPEDMLSWMRDYSKQGNVPYPLNRILVDRQMTRGEELDKIHEVGIEKENSRRPELERKAGNDQVQGKVISALRQKNSGSSYCELKRPGEEREPIKTGGIIVNPRDVHTSHRYALQPLPNSNLSFAQLKPWKQIEGEQSGVIHNSVVQQKPPHMSLSKELRKSRNPPSMTESVGTREFQGEFSRPGNVERVKGGKGTMLVNPEDMRAPSQTRDNDIENFDRLNPETRELLTSHARSKSMYYSTHNMVKPNEYTLQPMAESVMLPTQTTLNELDARLDRVLNKSRNVLFEASSGSVPSLTGLDDNIGMGTENYQSEIGYKGTSLGAF